MSGDPISTYVCAYVCALCVRFFECAMRALVGFRGVGLNSIYFETIEKQYKYYTNLSCHGLCLLAVWPGKVGRGGRRRRDRVQ